VINYSYCRVFGKLAVSLSSAFVLLSLLLAVAAIWWQLLYKVCDDR